MSVERDIGKLMEAVASLKSSQEGNLEYLKRLDDRTLQWFQKIEERLDSRQKEEAALREQAALRHGRLAGTVALIVAMVSSFAKDAIASYTHK